MYSSTPNIENENQILTSTSISETWRILSIDGSTVTIVRDEPTKPLILFGQAGYNNAIKELDEISKIYKNDLYAKSARSITVEDINKVLNYTEEEMKDYDGGSSTQGGYGYQNSEPINGKTYISIDYYYDGTSKISNTTDKYKMIFKNNLNSGYINYWIASQSLRVMTDVGFYVRCVGGGSVLANPLYYSYGFEGGFADLGVLPVVVLKNTVNVSGGPGTQAEPWIID